MEGYTIKSLIGEQVNPNLPIGECDAELSLGDTVVVRSSYSIGIVVGLPDKRGRIVSRALVLDVRVRSGETTIRNTFYLIQ